MKQLEGKEILRLAFLEATKSDDPVRKVGAVIVGADGKILGQGSNSLISSASDSTIRSLLSQNPEAKYYLLEHAERSAIWNVTNSGNSAMNATMACTLHPCADCMRAIIQSGIRKLIIPASAIDLSTNPKWSIHYEMAVRLSIAAGIEVDRI